MIKKKEFVSGIFFLFGDIIGVSISFILSYFIRFYSGILPVTKGIPPTTTYLEFLFLFIVLHVLTFSTMRSYGRQLIWRRSDETITIFLVNILVIILALGIVSYLRTYGWITTEISHLFLFTYLIVNTVTLPIMRGITRAILKRRWKEKKTRAIIVGSGETVEPLLHALERFSPLGYEVVGVFGQYNGEKSLGNERKIIDFLKKYRVDEVYILHPLKEMDTFELVKLLSEHVLEIKIVPDLLGFVMLHHSFEQLNGVAAINITYVPLHGWNLVIKRIFDILVSLLAIVIFLPVMAVIALAILITSGSPVIFKQKRMGMDGKEFTIYKFRTMLPESDKDWVAPKDRVTPVGRFLRKWSLDELPQFFNVLKGDMSIVGPRPERPEFVEQFKKLIPKYMLRHKVKSGITGWAQVNGLRGNTSIEKRIRYDLYYIENWSLWLDLKIIIMTLWRFRQP